MESVSFGVVGGPGSTFGWSGSGLNVSAGLVGSLLLRTSRLLVSIPSVSVYDTWFYWDQEGVVMLGRTGVAHYGRRCSWAHLGEVPTMPPFFLDRGGKRSGKNCSVINVNG